jgi:hypothetical protein
MHLIVYFYALLLLSILRIYVVLRNLNNLIHLLIIFVCYLYLLLLFSIDLLIN